MAPEVVAFICIAAVISWVTYVVVDGFRRRQQLRVTSEFQTRLLDRIGSAREFGEFLTSEGGGKFLESLASTREGAPQLRILKALQSGAVMLIGGVALFIYSDLSESSIDPDVGNVINLFATLMTAIGLGLLISAVISFWLSRRMGLIDGKRGESRRDVTPSV